MTAESSALSQGLHQKGEDHEFKEFKKSSRLAVKESSNQKKSIKLD
jgi:hypothetical protein